MSDRSDDSMMFYLILFIALIFIFEAENQTEENKKLKDQAKKPVVEYVYQKVEEKEEPKLVAPKVELGEVTEGGKIE